MSLEENVLEGTLTADGEIELDRKPSLRPGRVAIILRSIPEVVSDPFWTRMQAIWDQQKTSSSASSDKVDIRKEWQERQTGLERLQEECRQYRDSKSQSK